MLFMYVSIRRYPSIDRQFVLHLHILILKHRFMFQKITECTVKSLMQKTTENQHAPIFYFEHATKLS